MKHVFVFSTLFANYETMSCNIFELLNVVIRLVIIFMVIFCSNYEISMCFICKNTYSSPSASMTPVNQPRSRFIGFKPFQIEKWGDFDFGRFLPVFTGRRFSPYNRFGEPCFVGCETDIYKSTIGPDS
jgi:hypothetical protein